MNIQSNYFLVSKIEHTADLELRSYGMDDANFSYHSSESFIKINGKEVFKTNRRGFTLVTITNDCKIGEITRYDTWGDDGFVWIKGNDDSSKLRDYLNALPDYTRLVGITYDSYEEFRNPFDLEARPVLTKMGIDASSKTNRNSLCFFLTKGKPELTVQSFAPRWQGPATLRCPLSCKAI